MEEIVYAGTFILTQMMIRMADKMSENKQKGFNALQCAFKSGFINVYYLIEAAYYAARQFGQDTLLIELAEEYYPYLCTCIQDVDKIGEMLGSSAESQAAFAKCGETDYDQCWFPVLQDDGTTYACDNCDYYWYNSDASECFACETAVETDDGSGTITYSCHSDCTDYSLSTDVCVYDCTAVITGTDSDGNATNSCRCDDYAYDSGTGACAAV